MPNRKETDYAHGMGHTIHAPASEPGSCGEAPAAGLPAGSCSQGQQAQGQGLMACLCRKQYSTALPMHTAQQVQSCGMQRSVQTQPAHEHGPSLERKLASACHELGLLL